MPRSRSWRSLSLVGGAMVLFALAASAFSMKPAESAPPVAASAATSVIVKFNVGANENAVAALNAAHGTKQVEAIPALGLRVLRLPPGAAAATVAEAYSKNPLVEFAEPNELVAPEAVPNDPNYGSQWHLPNIGAPAAWDTATAAGILVGVCDTGVLGSHPDLVDVLRSDLGWNAADGSTNWSPVAGHGTMVAGTIAATTNNGLGVAGVARGANIIPVRISNFTDGSAYVSDAAKCIQYSADRGARAINVSYDMAGSAALDTAGAYARSKGALTFVAAGNSGIDPGWQSFPNFISVSATDWNNARASWSNFGQFVDLSAPGVSIMTTWSDGTYGAASGTSFASPVAAGVAALVFGRNSALTASEVQNILLSNSDDFGPSGWDASFGSGRVNAVTAVAAAGGSPPPTPTAVPSATPSPTATPQLSTTPSPTPTVPAPTSTPAPQPTSTPTLTPTVQPTPALKTDTFTGKLGSKGQPTSRTHSFTVSAAGPLTVKLTWVGKAKLSYTVYNASGQPVQTGSANGTSTVLSNAAAGTYTVTVRTTSGQASYTATVSHY